MEIKISKKDVLWGYIGQFFNIAAGFITLPLILHMLSTEEIAMNYLMLSVSTLVALMDFGFTPQINRLVSYVYSGANQLNKEGIVEIKSNEVDYYLLYKLISVTKKIYSRISFIAILLMLTVGTWYMYGVTESFTNVNNSFIIWCVFSLSTFFTVFYKYFDALLIGRGLVKEQKQTVVYSKLFNIGLVYLLLLCGFGLLGVCISYLLSPFVGRALAHRFFYDKKTKERLTGKTCPPNEYKEIFDAIWFNAKKAGINFIGTYCTRQFGMFISGLFLSAPVIASYGLMMQLVSILSSISSTFLNTFQPKIISARVEGDREKTIRTFSGAITVFYMIYITGAIFLVMLGPCALSLIRSNASFPALYILLAYLMVAFLEEHHSNFAVFISTGNTIPFVPAALISGGLICLGDFLVLKFTSLGLIGIIGVQGLVQLAYNNWRWPKWVLDDYTISYPKFLKYGSKEVVKLLKNGTVSLALKK